ncbi:DUF3489 domain-containing protein [Sphingomonas sp. RB1R13]|uniref:DUF3489 domain-containing protein n=1 Tax=Sphingomonas sp. RB1R13 TaxID=3096159 RepID=UPI002FC6BAB5
MQFALLVAANQRDEGSLFPPTQDVENQTARFHKSISGLIKLNLATEIEVTDAAQAWRVADDRHIGVIIADAGRTVVAGADKTAEFLPVKSVAVLGDPARAAPQFEPDRVQSVVAATPNICPGTKQFLVVDLMRSNAGASLDQLSSATGWLPHTTRAALTGLRKRGFSIATEKAEGVTLYRIASADLR